MDLRSKGSLKAEINVTPLADVILVLVINMMLFAPTGHGGEGVTLPEAGNSMVKRAAEDQTVVTIDARGRFYLNAYPIRPEDVVSRVQRAIADRKDKAVYLHGDKDASFSAIMSAMDALRKAEIDDIALITERKQIPRGSTAEGGR